MLYESVLNCKLENLNETVHRRSSAGGFALWEGTIGVDTQRIAQLAAAGDLHEFYTSAAWLTLRGRILEQDHNECQSCKSKGRYRRANTVHHVNYVKLHPELALSETYIDDNGYVKRNLVSLCHDCHEEIHGHRQRRKKYLTEEKW